MIRFAKAIGANTDFLTAQAFVFPKSATQEPSQLYLGVIITASGEDVFSKVRQIAPQIEETFTQSEKTAGERLNEIVSLINEQLKSLENLQVLTAVWKEGTLYLKSQGSARAYLERNSELMDLTSKAEAGELVSGYLKEGDKLLLISPKAIDPSPDAKSLNWDLTFIKELIDSDIDNMEEELEADLQQLQTLEPIATILIQTLPSENKSHSENIIPQLQSDSIEPFKPKINIDFSSIYPKLIKFIPRTKKNITITAGISLVLIFALLGIFNLQKNKSKTQAEFNSFYNQAQQKFEQAKSQKDSDTSQAQLSLSEAKSNLEKALKIDPKNSNGQNLKKQIEQESGSILKVNEISDWAPFLSLDLIKNNFTSTKMSYSLGKILLLDDSEKTLVTVDLKNKTNQILAGQVQLGQAKFASINGENVFIYSQDKGVLKIDTSEGKDAKVTTVAKPDPDWGQINDLFAFSGNVYLLDGIKHQIYKYTPTKSGYSDKFSYLKPDQKANFSGSKKMLIDYSVWVLNTGPEILKYTGGYADNFSPSGLDKNLSELASFFIPEDSDNAYFLDNSNARIVILKKTGQYISQYHSDKFKTATDFIVDEKNKKLYLLDGGKIFQTDLR